MRRVDEMENAPKPRGESAKIDLKEKLPELPEGYNLDGTPKAHSPTPDIREIADGKAGWTAYPLDAARNGKKRDAGGRNDHPMEAGIQAEPEKPEAGKEEGAEENATFKGLVPLGTLKAEAEEGAERRMERTVWCKGKWVQMEIRDGKCQFAFVKEPMMQGELILDALNAIAEISEEICEAANELAAEAKRTLKGRK